jgi:hypothetical protein
MIALDPADAEMLNALCDAAREATWAALDGEPDPDEMTDGEREAWAAWGRGE